MSQAGLRRAVAVRGAAFAAAFLTDVAFAFAVVFVAGVLAAAVFVADVRRRDPDATLGRADAIPDRPF